MLICISMKLLGAMKEYPPQTENFKMRNSRASRI